MKEALNIKMEYSDFNSAGVIPLEGLHAETLIDRLKELARQETGEEGGLAVVKIETMESVEYIRFIDGYASMMDSLRRGGMAAAVVIISYDDGEVIEQKMILELTQILEV